MLLPVQMKIQQSAAELNLTSVTLNVLLNAPMVLSIIMRPTHARNATLHASNALVLAINNAHSVRQTSCRLLMELDVFNLAPRDNLRELRMITNALNVMHNALIV